MRWITLLKRLVVRAIGARDNAVAPLAEALEGRTLLAVDFELQSATFSADATRIDVRYAITGAPPFDPAKGNSYTYINVWDRAKETWAYLPPYPKTLKDAQDGSIFAQIPIVDGAKTVTIQLDEPYRPEPGHYGFVVIDWSDYDAEADETNNVIRFVAPVEDPTSDVQVKGLKAGFKGDLAHVAFQYKGTATFRGDFEVGLYRSADAKFSPATDVLVTGKTFTANGTSAVRKGTFALGSPLVADPALPYVLVVADPLDLRREKNEANNVAAFALPTVKVEATGPLVEGKVTVDLLSKVKLRPVLNVPLPAGVRISSYLIEQRRQGDPTWRAVAAVVDAAPPVLVQRLAGDVEYRATATIEGIDYTTPEGKETHVEVRFPKITTILNSVLRPPDSLTIKAFLKEAWEGIHQVNQAFRRVTGNWLTLDTKSGLIETETALSFTRTLARNEKEALLAMGARPADKFSADGLSAKYVVAAVRMHGIYKDVDEVLGTRAVGPTAEEAIQAGIFNDDTPTVVLDYVGEVVGDVRQISPGHPEDAPFKIWRVVVFNSLTGDLVDRRQF